MENQRIRGLLRSAPGGADRQKDSGEGTRPAGIDLFEGVLPESQNKAYELRNGQLEKLCDGPRSTSPPVLTPMGASIQR